MPVLTGPTSLVRITVLPLYGLPVSVGMRCGRISQRCELFISDLAIRLSYGYTGNIDRSSYPIPMIFLSGYRYDENFVAESVTFPNPNIKWERKQDRNFGLDFGFWDNRIGGSFNYYWNTGKDLLER